MKKQKFNFSKFFNVLLFIINIFLIVFISLNIANLLLQTQKIENNFTKLFSYDFMPFILYQIILISSFAISIYSIIKSIKTKKSLFTSIFSTLTTFYVLFYLVIELYCVAFAVDQIL